MFDKETTDRKKAEIEEQVEWLVKNYILDARKMNEAQRRIAEAVGPMKPIEANVWIFVMENFVEILEKTGGYAPPAVSLIKEAYRVNGTVYSGTPEECRDMADRLFHRGKPDE